MTEASAAHQPAEGPICQGRGAEYLECLQALAQELECAMQSLAANGLSTFGESVSRQVFLCSQLSGLAARHHSRVLDAGSVEESLEEGDLADRIELAKAKLVKLNRNYSALLNHTRRTVQMFAGLAQCYTSYPNAGMAAAPSRTWSSEL